MSLGENVDTEGQTDEPMEGQTDRQTQSNHNNSP